MKLLKLRGFAFCIACTIALFLVSAPIEMPLVSCVEEKGNSVITVPDGQTQLVPQAAGSTTSPAFVLIWSGQIPAQGDGALVTRRSRQMSDV